MRFLYPQLLWLLALIPIIALLLGKRSKGPAIRYSSLSLFDAHKTSSKFSPGHILLALRLLALALGIVGLARPQLGKGSQEIEASGIDIVLCIDISLSMDGLDMDLGGRQASRFEAVQSVITEFIKNRPSDRIGIVAFAGAPYLVSPITLDHDWLHLNLERLQIGVVQENGTAIGSGLMAAVNRLRSEKSKTKIVILLSDGASNRGSVSPSTAAEAAQALGIKVYTICAGTDKMTVRPVRDKNGAIVIMDGRPLLTRLPPDFDEEALKKISELTGGLYFRASNTKALQAVYNQIDKMEKTAIKVKKREHFDELFFWFVIPACLLITLEILLRFTIWRRLP
ncbi:MAG: VWA domain-containing protein [Verrucomicrobiota bacterium]|nr:VWA domain-containing protein [Verrucomicrobiota bacterium]